MGVLPSLNEVVSRFGACEILVPMFDLAFCLPGEPVVHDVRHLLVAMLSQAEK